MSQSHGIKGRATEEAFQEQLYRRREELQSLWTLTCLIFKTFHMHKSIIQNTTKHTTFSKKYVFLPATVEYLSFTV